MDKVKEEAEKYSDYLRQQMGDRLTSAVAEIIEQRPSDPVQHLAEYLYKSRNMRPPNSQILRHRRHHIQHWTTEKELNSRGTEDSDRFDQDKHLKNRPEHHLTGTTIDSHGADSIGAQNIHNRGNNLENYQGRYLAREEADSDEGFLEYGYDFITGSRLSTEGKLRNSWKHLHSGQHGNVHSAYSGEIDPNLKVHCFIKEFILQIGDLFNDEDIS